MQSPPGWPGVANDSVSDARPWRKNSTIPAVRAVAIEDVVADLGGLFHGVGPVRATPRWRGSWSPRRWRSSARTSPVRICGRQRLGFAPGARPAWPCVMSPLQVKENWQPGWSGAFIDHGADGMAVIAVVHAVEHHFGNGLLAAGAFAAGLVIQHFRQAAMLGQKLGHHRVGGGLVAAWTGAPARPAWAATTCVRGRMIGQRRRRSRRWPWQE